MSPNRVRFSCCGPGFLSHCRRKMKQNKCQQRDGVFSWNQLLPSNCGFLVPFPDRKAIENAVFHSGGPKSIPTWDDFSCYSLTPHLLAICSWNIICPGLGKADLIRKNILLQWVGIAQAYMEISYLATETLQTPPFFFFFAGAGCGNGNYAEFSGHTFMENTLLIILISYFNIFCACKVRAISKMTCKRTCTDASPCNVICTDIYCFYCCRACQVQNRSSKSKMAPGCFSSCTESTGWAMKSLQ